MIICARLAAKAAVQDASRDFLLWCLLLAALLSAPLCAGAVSPELKSVMPTGAQRGTDVEVTFSGERLQDVQEVLFYEPGLQVLNLSLVTNKAVKAQIKVLPDCALGEHHLRLRAASGLSELRTFLVGPYPVVQEVEPNNEPSKAQPIEPNHTVTGVIEREDVDCFRVPLKKGQLFSAEVEGMRLGRGFFDPRLTVLTTNGTVLADVDDTWLGMQDPFVSFLAPFDGACILRLRETIYGGGSDCDYRLHVGSFPRPTSVFPLGGKAGDNIPFTFYSEATGPFTNAIKLPSVPDDKFGLFAERDGLTAPTPNWIRVSDFPNVLASGANHDREHATAAPAAPPVAFNGILEKKGQEDWFSFPAVKGRALEFNVWARRLRSPLDSVIEVYNEKGKEIASNDDAEGADSSLKLTLFDSTNYFVRIRDTLGDGGRDFVYRLEVTPVQPSLTVKIPDVQRYDTQSRQYIVVPRGNRFATLIAARRSSFRGSLGFDIKDLPPGVKLVSGQMPQNTAEMPLVFEAAPDAPLGARLLDLTATGTNESGAVIGHFSQTAELVQGPPNNATYYSTTVNKLCVAVTSEAPFHLSIVEPKVPLVQGGSMPLEIVAERSKGFDEPIVVQMVWNPPGVSSQPEVTIPKGATNVFYPLSAGGGAEPRKWKIAVLGHATVEGGPLYVSSQLATLEVGTPYLTGKIETLWVHPGESGKLTVDLHQAKPFDGKATIHLCGLPDKVTAADKEITKDDQEVAFDVSTDAHCNPGSYRNLFCSVTVQANGQGIEHNIAYGGILRVTPRKKESGLAAATRR